MRWARTAALLTVLAVGVSCTGTDPEDPTTIDSRQFIDAYIDLRISALQTSNEEILPEERERILSEHGLVESDLVDFVDVHGRDPTYMQSVWDSVEVRLQARTDSINRAANNPP